MLSAHCACYVVEYVPALIVFNNVLVITTVITTKDQSGGIYSTGGQEFMAVVNKPRLWAYALRLSLFTAINPCHHAILTLT